MNKSRIIGILIFLIGLGLNFYSTNKIIAFISGASIAIGIALIILGKPLFKRKN